MFIKFTGAEKFSFKLIIAYYMHDNVINRNILLILMPLNCI